MGFSGFAASSSGLFFPFLFHLEWTDSGIFIKFLYFIFYTFFIFFPIVLVIGLVRSSWLAPSSFSSDSQFFSFGNWRSLSRMQGVLSLGKRATCLCGTCSLSVRSPKGGVVGCCRHAESCLSNCSGLSAASLAGWSDLARQGVERNSGLHTLGSYDLPATSPVPSRQGRSQKQLWVLNGRL